MPNSHIENSEIVLGLLMEGRQSRQGYSPEYFDRAYSKVAKDVIDGKPLEELIPLHGSSTIQTCLHAAHSVNGLGEEADWRTILKDSLTYRLAAEKLKKLQKNLENGLPVEPDAVRDAFSSILYSEKVKSVRADELLEQEYSPFIESGSQAIDGHVMGIPNVGTFILGAKTFTGKTTVAIMLAKNFLLRHPEKEVMFITLEDMAQGWMDRAKTLLGNMPKEFWRRFIILEFAKGAEDIIAEAERYPNVGLILLDYIDYLVEDESFEKYASMYRKMAMAAKTLAVSHGNSMPIGILAQFNRQYKGGVPQPHHLYYTGEAGAWMVCMLYNPNNDWFSDDGENGKNRKSEAPKYHLPAVPGKGYLVFWKVKGGFRLKGADEFPGAVSVNWTPKYGFDLDDEGQWFSLAKETRA